MHDFDEGDGRSKERKCFDQLSWETVHKKLAKRKHLIVGEKYQ